MEKTMKTNPNDSISPVHEPTRVLQNGSDDYSSCILAGGLTKREYFAAMAMQGFLSMPSDRAEQYNEFDIFTLSVKAANALIAELNKEQL